MNTKDRDELITASESVLCAIHNVRRALKHLAHGTSKGLAESVYSNLVDLDASIRGELEKGHR